jgi:hypothetical protein
MEANFKTDLLQRFQGHAIESTLEEGGVECDLIRPASPKQKMMIELWYTLDNGQYQTLLDIRFKHPDSPGYTRLQKTFPCNLPYPLPYSAENVQKALAIIDERMTLGWTEFLYWKQQKHYKSLIILPKREQSPQKFVYREEAKPLYYILLSTLFGRLYRYFKGISIETRQITP